MFDRLVKIEAVARNGERRLAPLNHIDNFAMRNFTNDAIFDDTLPVAEGRLEIGRRVPLDLLCERMEDWFRRKRYLSEDEHLEVQEIV